MTEYHKSPPREGARMSIVATGSEGSSFWMDDDTDASWQAVTLPENTECKHALIKIHSGDGTLTDPVGDCIGFLFSFNSDGTEWAPVSEQGISINIGKVGGTIAYVKALAGHKISVTTLY